MAPAVPSVKGKSLEIELRALPEVDPTHEGRRNSGKIDSILSLSRNWSLRETTVNGVATLPHLIHVIVSNDGRSLP